MREPVPAGDVHGAEHPPGARIVHRSRRAGPRLHRRMKCSAAKTCTGRSTATAVPGAFVPTARLRPAGTRHEVHPPRLPPGRRHAPRPTAACRARRTPRADVRRPRRTCPSAHGTAASPGPADARPGRRRGHRPPDPRSPCRPARPRPARSAARSPPPRYAPAVPPSPPAVNVSCARRSTRTRSTGSAPGSRATHGSVNWASPEGDAAGDIVTPGTRTDERCDHGDGRTLTVPPSRTGTETVRRS